MVLYHLIFLDVSKTEEYSTSCMLLTEHSCSSVGLTDKYVKGKRDVAENDVTYCKQMK